MCYYCSLLLLLPVLLLGVGVVGFNYYGTERMYSGTDGRELEVDVFIGVVYYQRLRHMVFDKYQACSQNWSINQSLDLFARK